MSASPILRCGGCLLPLPPDSWSEGLGAVCSRCGKITRVTVFPAVAHTQTGAMPEAIESETEASCFYHPRNRVAVPCEECGRFLCNLCKLEADGRAICPVCFGTRLRERKLLEFETRRTNYDTVALALTAVVLFFIWPAMFSAPVALFITFRHWNSPRGLLRKSRFRYYLAALLATGELVGLIALLVLIIRQTPFFR